MQKILYFLIFLIILGSQLSESFASSLSVRVNPQEPLRGEEFELIFDIVSDESDEPEISFDPIGVEVVGQGQSSFSSSTTIINGRISTEKKLTVTYLLNSSTAGLKKIKDIKVRLGSLNLRSRDLRFKVNTESLRRARNIFLEAVPSKSEVFIGEGFNIDYYLYSKSPVVSADFDNFPKLNDFVKRFHNPNPRPERVRYQGEIYYRSLRYSARLYGIKVGELVADPLSLRVQVAQSNRRGFGVFGQVFSTPSRVKRVSSGLTKIIVKALPSQGVPKNFTGLVGEHSFELKTRGSKFLVNEPIELSLKVKGPGLLESYNGPTIYEHSELENFDIKTNFQEEGNKLALKNYEYTYLARSAFEIPSRNLDLYYFDPDEISFKKVSLKIPELIIGGGATIPTKNQLQDQLGDNDEGLTDKPRDLSQQLTGALPPYFDLLSYKSWVFYANNALLGLFSLIFFFYLVGFIQKKLNDKSDEEKLFAIIKKEGLSHKNFYDLFTCLLPEPRQDSVMKRITRSKLPENLKTYFEELFSKINSREYRGLIDTSESKQIRVDYHKFKQAIKLLTRQKTKNNKEKSKGKKVNLQAM